MKETFRRYLPYLKDYKKQYFVVFIGIILTIVSTTATAHIMKPMMDEMFIAKDEKMLIIIPFLFIAIYLTKSIGRYIQAVSTSYIGLHIVKRLRDTLLAKMLYFDMSFLYENRNGDLISRITNDINRIQYFVSNMIPDLIRESLMAITLIAYTVYLNYTLAFYAYIVLPLVIYPIIFIAKRLKKLSKKAQESNAGIVVRLTEIFNNSEIIKANATEEFELNRFKEENNRFFKLSMKYIYVGEIVSPFLEVVAVLGLAGVIYIGAKEVYANNMSVGEFFAFFTAIGLALQPIRRVGSIYSKIQDAIAASERVFAMLDKTNTITDGDISFNQNIHTIQFSNVSLNYGDKVALQNINFEITEGKTIALVGDSGGGKSSLVNLLIRFYDVTEGTILLNGENIKNLTQHSLREKISIVSQRVYIFQDTLAANVAYGHTIDREKVVAALELANAKEFVHELANGIDEVMEEFGANLSGGQRQRIAIARAIYKDSSVLILDEATSALDNRSEKEIQKSLQKLAKDKITIIIAHRLSTIEHADIILLFQNGEIIDRGNHASLKENSQYYQKLLQGIK